MVSQTNNKNPHWIDEVVGVDRDIECKTGLKSTVIVKGPDGKEINPTAIPYDDNGDPVPAWEELKQGSYIDWEATTISDGENKSDKLYVDLAYYDMFYFTKVFNEVLDNLTEAEEELILTDISAYMDLTSERTLEAINPMLLYKTVWSDTVTTDANGKASGRIEFPPQWPKTEYNLLIRYGYDWDSEKSDWDKSVDFWWKEMGPTIVFAVISLIVAIVLAMTGVGAPLAVGALIFTVEIIAELVFMYRNIQENAWGMAGLNQYGCDFPTNSWVHGYGFGLETEIGNEEAVESEISPMNQEMIVLGEDYIKAQGLAKSVAVGTTVMLIFFTLVARIKKRRRGDG